MNAVFIPLPASEVKFLRICQARTEQRLTLEWTEHDLGPCTLVERDNAMDSRSTPEIGKRKIIYRRVFTFVRQLQGQTRLAVDRVKPYGQLNHCCKT